MAIGAILGTIAAIIHAVAYLDYNREIINGRLRPNSSTWSIWAFDSLLGTASYSSMTADWNKYLLTNVNSFLCIATFLIALRLGRFGRPSRSDWIALGLGISTVIVWWHYQSADLASLVILSAAIIGFIPTYLLAWRNPYRERPRPWLIWTVGYVILTTTITANWNGKWVELALPVSMIACHVIVAIIIRHRKITLTPPTRY